MPARAKANKDTQHKLHITAQQTRFESSALVAPTTREILIKDLNISLGQKEILSHADLHLKETSKTVLHGRNGVGKSTLIKAIADGLIPGISFALKILLLGQTTLAQDVEDGLAALSLNDGTVLDHVLHSDKTRQTLLHEESLLANALENSEDPLAAVKAVRAVQHGRLLKRFEEINMLAERRSGARGKNARKDLIITEEEVVTSEARLTEDLTGVDSNVVGQEMQAAAELLADVRSSLEAMNAVAASDEARKVLSGLGFSEEQINSPVSRLSGGWRTRCKIACALSQKPDVLLLDEPTNFLDLRSIIWLQNYVQGLEDITTLVVTHDRDFADAIADELLIMRHNKLEVFKGTLSGYESELRKKAKWLTKMKNAQDKQKKHMEQTIQNNVRAAKQKGDDKKLAQAASRKKKVEDRMGLQVSATGGRFKLNRDLAGYHTTSRAAIEIPEFDPPVRMRLPEELAELRFPGALISLEGVGFAYSRKSPDVVQDITLTIHPGERVGLCGSNGSGKSTLVSLIAASTEDGAAVSPNKGTITSHPRLKIARFSQHAVEQLELFGRDNPASTALSHLMEVSAGSLTEQAVRGILGGLGLQGQIVSEVPIAALSGGQKVRLALAKLLWSPPNLLILDEVTTHLDADTIIALIKCLRVYSAALLVVTHDRFFMRCVVEGQNPEQRADDDDGESDDDDSDDSGSGGKKAGPGRVYRMVKGKLKNLERGMDQYEEIVGRALARSAKLQAG